MLSALLRKKHEKLDESGIFPLLISDTAKQLIEKIQKLPENHDVVTREINEGYQTGYQAKCIKTDVENLCKQAQEIQIEEPEFNKQVNAVIRCTG